MGGCAAEMIVRQGRMQLQHVFHAEFQHIGDGQPVRHGRFVEQAVAEPRTAHDNP